MNQPTLVRPEHILVMWGSLEKHDKFMEQNNLTQMHRILAEKPGASVALLTQLRRLQVLGNGIGA
jgi:hypothetical protein